MCYVNLLKVKTVLKNGRRMIFELQRKGYDDS